MQTYRHSPYNHHAHYVAGFYPAHSDWISEKIDGRQTKDIVLCHILHRDRATCTSSLQLAGCIKIGSRCSHIFPFTFEPSTVNRRQSYSGFVTLGKVLPWRLQLHLSSYSTIGRQNKLNDEGYLDTPACNTQNPNWQAGIVLGVSPKVRANLTALPTAEKAKPRTHHPQLTPAIISPPFIYPKRRKHSLRSIIFLTCARPPTLLPEDKTPAI